MAVDLCELDNGQEGSMAIRFDIYICKSIGGIAVFVTGFVDSLYSTVHFETYSL